MNWTKFYGWLLKGCLAMVVLFIFSIANTTLIFAQGEGRGNDTEVTFDPPDRGTPHSEDAPGSRGDCPKVELGMKSIVGENPRFQLAVNPYPTFWVYVPYTRQEVPTGRFILQNEKEESEENFWQTDLQLPEKPGIVSITLPTSQKPLVPGEVYGWYFEVNCPGKSANDEVTIDLAAGFVELVSSPDLQSQLNSASLPIERVKIYAENGIWYDAITELAQLRVENPENTDYENSWIKLLSDEKVNLKHLVQKPIIETEIITNFPPE